MMTLDPKQEFKVVMFTAAGPKRVTDYLGGGRFLIVRAAISTASRPTGAHF